MYRRARAIPESFRAQWQKRGLGREAQWSGTQYSRVSSCPTHGSPLPAPNPLRIRGARRKRSLLWGPAGHSLGLMALDGAGVLGSGIFRPLGKFLFAGPHSVVLRAYSWWNLGVLQALPGVGVEQLPCPPACPDCSADASCMSLALLDVQAPGLLVLR